MAYQEEGQVKSQFEALSQNAVLDVLLPRSANIDVANVIRNGSAEDLHRAPQRRNLFFDEKAVITLVLKTPLSEDTVRTILPNLEFTLAAHATDAVPQGSGNAASASGKHDLTSKTVSAFGFKEAFSSGNETYVVWKPVLDLVRPRARLQRPAVYFTVYFTVSPAAVALARAEGKDFLTSLEPLPSNVLEPLQFDPSLVTSKIYLSETRITKVGPGVSRNYDDIKPIRSASKRAFPIVPALFTRIRYSALPDSVVASLHLETSQIISGKVSVKDVSVDIPGAEIEKLNPQEWPKECLAGDETVLLYKLTQKSDSSATGPSTVSVQIDAAVFQEDSPQIELDLRWQAQVHLSQTTAKPMYKWSRPLSSSNLPPPGRASLHGGSRPTSFDAGQKATFSESGMTFNFWVPDTLPSKKNFKLNVQCINQSNRPRRFAIVVAQPRKTATKPQSNPNGDSADLIASLFDTLPPEGTKEPDVLDLNPDVRIGPLPPGACYETEMRFWACKTGVLDLGVIRVVDLDTRQTIEVRELPDIIMLGTAKDKDESGN